jgi:hypothetical protein
VGFAYSLDTNPLMGVITYDRLCNLRSSYYINCWSPGMNAVAYAGFALR